MLSAVFGYGQSRYPNENYDNRLSSLGNLWAYVERVDHALDSANKTIDSLTKELRSQRILLQFNTDMGNYYIRKVDSFRLHGIGIYPSYKATDTLALGPFYIF